MFRFSIRDLLWLMVVVGLAIGLYQGRARQRRLELQLQRAEKEMRVLDFKNGYLLEAVAKQKLTAKRMDAAAPPEPHRP